MTQQSTQSSLIDLGKKGVAVYGEDYRNQTQFLFSDRDATTPPIKNVRVVSTVG